MTIHHIFTEMPLLIKRIKRQPLRFLLSAFVYFLLFLAMDIVLLLSLSFSNKIVIYSGGYDPDCYYSRSPVHYDASLSLREEEWGKASDIRCQVRDDQALYSCYGTETVVTKRFGVLLAARAHMAIADYSIDASREVLDRAHCYVSQDIVGLDFFERDGKSYPVAGTFATSLSENLFSAYRDAGIDQVSLVVIIDPGVDVFSGDNSSFVCRGSPLAHVPGLVSGEDLNAEYQSNFDIFRPLFYVVTLVPFSFAMLFFSLIVVALQKDETKEMAILGLFGMKRMTNIARLFLLRFLQGLLGFFLSMAIFLPILVANGTSKLSVFLLFLIQLFFVAFFDFLLSHHQAKQAYPHSAFHGGKKK